MDSDLANIPSLGAVYAFGRRSGRGGRRARLVERAPAAGTTGRSGRWWPATRRKLLARAGPAGPRRRARTRPRAGDVLEGLQPARPFRYGATVRPLAVSDRREHRAGLPPSPGLPGLGDLAGPAGLFVSRKSRSPDQRPLDLQPDPSLRARTSARRRSSFSSNGFPCCTGRFWCCGTLRAFRPGGGGRHHRPPGSHGAVAAGKGAATSSANCGNSGTTWEVKKRG